MGFTHKKKGFLMLKSIELNLDYLNARTLLLPTANSITLALVGCGGTGSWLASSIARVGRILIEKFTRTVNIVFIDPDRVEPKNCFRQNFCQAEVGRFKAESLAFRYSLAWGIQIGAIAEPFNGRQIVAMGRELVVFVGGVDRGEARRSIEEAVKKYDAGWGWWLDCGNHHTAGQVLLGSGGARPKDPFSLPRHCAWLPLPSAQHPELLELEAPEPEAKREMSCADMAMADSQGLAINQAIAAQATDYLVRLLLTRDLVKFATYLDLASGAVRSRYITPENCAVMKEKAQS
jgi:PRTRC genetic system ThiF family protein